MLEIVLGSSGFSLVLVSGISPGVSGTSSEGTGESGVFGDTSGFVSGVPSGEVSGCAGCASGLTTNCGSDGDEGSG
ncbi:MAG: hypothetical protein IJP97_01280, partial [Synergistaceae bacterium]|nr:hypothetical protein [Synergistaceae bacterium]